jgi:hypothetical protein
VLHLIKYADHTALVSLCFGQIKYADHTALVSLLEGDEMGHGPALNDFTGVSHPI